MYLSRTYSAREDIPKGAETLYQRTGTLFIMRGGKRGVDAPNPWEPGNWNLTAQGLFLKQHGWDVANVFAAMAGSAIGASKSSGTFKRDLQVLIQRRDITIVNGGGGTGDDNALAVGLTTKV